MPFQAGTDHLTLITLGGLTQIAGRRLGDGGDRLFCSGFNAGVGQVQVGGAQAENLRPFLAVAQGFQGAAADQMFKLAHIAGPVVGQ
ncbi:hypothetical protein D3C73_1285320 [compost metagenome]